MKANAALLLVLSGTALALRASQTIAERVETEAELAMLRALGVPLAQGYLLGRPAPVDTWAEPAPIPVRQKARASRIASL
jgi:EAL domain-containing protein (putative c-di-GMP-specific phosphodiesterase class I)